MKAALAKRNPKPGLIFHTDRGIECRSYDYQTLFDEHGVIASMNRPGQTTDNAFAESFFHALKAEHYRGRSFASMQDLRHGLAGYINPFYNRQRMRFGVDCHSPEEYEQIAA